MGQFSIFLKSQLCIEMLFIGHIFIFCANFEIFLTTCYIKVFCWYVCFSKAVAHYSNSLIYADMICFKTCYSGNFTKFHIGWAKIVALLFSVFKIRTPN